MQTKITATIIIPSENGFYFSLENRTPICLKEELEPEENSWEATRRIIAFKTGELRENFEYLGVVEYKENNLKEICFVYFLESSTNINPIYNLVSLNREEVEKLNIQPRALKELILSKHLRCSELFLQRTI